MAALTPILSTKLFIPPSNPRHVLRPRLIALLEEGLQARLMVLSAPAGFGKTTLLSDWIFERMKDARSPVIRPNLMNTFPANDGGRMNSLHPSAFILHPSRFAWLSLDENDNDLVRFLSYLAAALQRVEPGIDQGLSGVLNTPQFPQVDALLNSLINILADVQDPIVLVLDDYHLIEAQEIHDALNYLIDHRPPPLHMIIATRVDPPLRLARWRARGQLIEIRQNDLRFTPQEAAEFLRQSRGLELSEDQAAALALRTEGWIAGLQMAALALQPAQSPQSQEDFSSFIQSFTGSSRFILDYLVEEVLIRQPAEIQSFLLSTSILDRLCATLCDAVLGDRGVGEKGKELSLPYSPTPLSPIPSSPSQQILEYLEHSNLFLIALDGERRWYRYHHLFAELLRQRLETTRPGDIPDLHRRASLWFEENGLLPEAIDHALAAARRLGPSAKDYERAVALVEAAAEPTLTRSEMTTFLGWVDSLPDHLVRARPYLCVYHACALLLCGRSLGMIESRLRDAQQAGADGAVSEVVTAFEGFLAGFRGDSENSVRRSHSVLEAVDLERTASTRAVDEAALLPLTQQNRFFRSLVAAFHSIAQIMFEDPSNARHELEKAARISLEAGHWMVHVHARCQLAEILMMQGQLRAADREYEQVLETYASGKGSPLPVTGLAYIGRGELLREWNELEQAEQSLQQGMELIRRWGEINLLDAYITMARIKQAQGAADRAHEYIRLAAQLAAQFDVSNLDDRLVSIIQARLWIAQGVLGPAVSWMQERGLDQDFNPAELQGQESKPFSYIYLRELELITLARLRLALDQPVQALEILGPLLQLAEKQDFIRIRIEMLILQAVAFQAQDDLAGAFVSLQRALTLAEPEGYVRIFLDEGEPLSRLIFDCRSAMSAAEGMKPETRAGDPSAQAPGKLISYMDRLLSAFPPYAAELSQTKIGDRANEVRTPSTILDPLSNRELEVLRWIAAGLSNQEIASQMVIALSTVKTHVHNIYQKLGVTNRTLAAARARELDLL